MKTVTKLGLAAALAAVFAAPVAFAQNDETSGQVMQGNGTMGMMRQMGPMMEACTGMMQAMTNHMEAHKHSADEG